MAIKDQDRLIENGIPNRSPPEDSQIQSPNGEKSGTMMGEVAVLKSRVESLRAEKSELQRTLEDVDRSIIEAERSLVDAILHEA